jgi:integrase
VPRPKQGPELPEMPRPLLVARMWDDRWRQEGATISEDSRSPAGRAKADGDRRPRLRISDVVTLAREHIQGNHLEKRAVKNKKWIRVELPSVVLEALDRLPPPKAAARDNKRYFYSDTTGLRSLVKGAWRTMNAVFKRSGVEGAHPHRFRHTLASELLGKGGDIDKVAAILGDSAAIIRRYYAKWTPEYQSRQDALIRTIHGTELAQTEEQAPKC